MVKETVGHTVKRKLIISISAGFLLFGIVLGIFGFTGSLFALPLGGMGDFYVSFDRLEGKGFTLNPQIGETGIEDEAPLVRNRIDSATIENLKIYKDLKLPTGSWIRINITASEPTEIQGLIQDARFIDANLTFDEMIIEQADTSEMSAEEMFTNNWKHQASTVTITDALIVTDYLFQNLVSLNGAQISLERISDPDTVENVSDSKGGNSSGTETASHIDNSRNGGELPSTTSSLFLPIFIGTVCLMIGVIFLLIRHWRLKKSGR